MGRVGDQPARPGLYPYTCRRHAPAARGVQLRTNAGRDSTRSCAGETVNWIKHIFARRQLYADLSEEIQQHLQEKDDALVAQGMSREEATAVARREFDNVALLEERSREVWQWSFLESLFSDIRYALRQLRRSPAFALVAVLTLALGIGANTAVFSVVNAVALRPLPFPDPDRLVSVQSLNAQQAPRPVSLSYPNFLDFRTQNQVFEQIACYRESSFTLSRLDRARQVDGEIVSWDLFSLLGVGLHLGRGFLPEEEAPGARVLVLSHPLWQEQFGADPDIVGRSITLNGQPFAVVGVARQDFAFLFGINPFSSGQPLRTRIPLSVVHGRSGQSRGSSPELPSSRLGPRWTPSQGLWQSSIPTITSIILACIFNPSLRTLSAIPGNL